MIGTADRVDRFVLLEWQEEQPAPVLDALMPLGLPPAAVLVVRRVAVVAEPPAVPAAVSAEVAEASRRAARPVRGLVDPHADAVLFADEAEVVACYLVAIRAGRLADWWWAQLAGSLPPPVVDAVVGDPAVPLAGVVATLSDWGWVDEVLTALSPPGRLVLLNTLVEQHDLWMRPGSPRSPAVAPGSAATEVPPDVRADGSGGEPPTAYEVGRRGTTTDLARVVTGAGFVSSVVSLVEQLLGRSETPSTRRQPLPPASVSRPVVPYKAPTGRPADPDVGAAVPSSDATAVARDRLREDLRTAVIGPAGPEVPPVMAEPEQRIDTAPAGAVTGLAGVFYLVNVFRRLDLRALGLADAAPWDVVDAMARAVLDVEEHRDDPAWLGLQTLAGRSPGEPPAPDVLSRCAVAMAQVPDDLALEPEEPTMGELVAVPGRLVVDLTHVEVFIALDAVELAVRRRALDADPGWIPSLGRVIRFHFVGGEGG